MTVSTKVLYRLPREWQRPTSLNFRPMAFAYAQLGDPTILQCIWRLFRWRLENGGPAGYEVKDALWALSSFEAAGLLEVYRNEWNESVD